MSKQQGQSGIEAQGPRLTETTYVRESGNSLYTSPESVVANDPDGPNGASSHGNDDTLLNFTAGGGNDGKGKPLFNHFVQMKRTDKKAFQENLDEQRPPHGPVGRSWRRYVSGKSVTHPENEE